MEEKYCGVWGHMREEFLKANKPKLYELLVEEGDLEDYLNGYQEAYSSRAEKMAEELATERGVNAELYKSDSLTWILETEKIQEEVHNKLENEIQS
ncbi:MAG: TnpV protein [Selenomonadaceae bacterium]|nr:TnpV protein [Selenomonadaceae bacterium]